MFQMEPAALLTWIGHYQTTKGDTKNKISTPHPKENMPTFNNI